MKPDKRNHLIDLLRFLSALWVAFYHFNQPIPDVNNWYRSFLKFGYLGVPVFFVISGYCVILSTHHAKSWKDFIIRRLFRIFPPYLFSLFVTLTIILLFKLITGNNSISVLPKTPVDILLTLTLLTKPFSNVITVNWVYWSLTCELFFYLIICISLISAARFQFWVLILISVLCILVPVVKVGPLFFLMSWPAFALGVGIYFIQIRKNLILSVLLLLLNSLALIKTFLLTNQLPYFITTAITVLLISISIKYRLKDNMFSRFGEYAYSVYLLHVPIGIYLIGYFKNNTIQQNIYYNIVYDVLTYIVVFTPSYYVFKFIELPSIKTGKKLASKLVA